MPPNRKARQERHAVMASAEVSPERTVVVNGVGGGDGVRETVLSGNLPEDFPVAMDDLRTQAKDVATLRDEERKLEEAIAKMLEEKNAIAQRVQSQNEVFSKNVSNALGVARDCLGVLKPEVDTLAESGRMEVLVEKKETLEQRIGTLTVELDKLKTEVADVTKELQKINQCEGLKRAYEELERMNGGSGASTAGASGGKPRKERNREKEKEARVHKKQKKAAAAGSDEASPNGNVE